jgi:hypothetical protein
MNPSEKNQIDGHGEEIDGVGKARLQQNAKDLAEQDGRAEARDSDRELALRELTGPEADSAPEIPAGAEGVVTWDESPESTGHFMQETPSEDEADVSSELAEEGRGEAEQDLRRAADAETHPRHAPPQTG